MSKSILFALAGLFVLSSCTKKDSVDIIETEEPIELGFRMSVNGVAIDSDAYAAYCQNDSIEFFVISNKEENLVWPLSINNFEAGDFTYFTNISDTGTNWGYGGQGLGEDITGFPGLSILFSDSIIEIDSNDGEIAIGSAEGTLLGMDGQGSFVEFPYVMDFVAEIVQESSFCD